MILTPEDTNAIRNGLKNGVDDSCVYYDQERFVRKSDLLDTIDALIKQLQEAKEEIEGLTHQLAHAYDDPPSFDWAEAKKLQEQIKELEGEIEKDNCGYVLEGDEDGN